MEPQRSTSRAAATHRSAARLSRAAALLAWVAVGCGSDAVMVGQDAGMAGNGGTSARDSGAVTDGGDVGSEEPSRETLAHPSLWQAVDAAGDPFDDRPAQVSCEESAYRSEILGGELAYSVDSTLCDYLTVRQDSRASVSVGDEVEVVFSHFPLSAPDEDEAEAHLAVMLGDILVAERRVAIPSQGAAYRITWTSDQKVPEDTPVYFHVHNHGQNEYSLESVELVSSP